MARARVSQYVVEALVPSDVRNPTTVTGAGVSQYVIEALVSGSGKVRVSQFVIEVLFTGNDTQSPPPEEGGGTPTPVTHTFGYAV